MKEGKTTGELISKGGIKYESIMSSSKLTFNFLTHKWFQLASQEIV